MTARAEGETFTFSSGAVLLDAGYSGDNIIIQNGVFSVTVSGATDVNIIFDGVTIDRRYATDALNGSRNIVNNVTGQTLYGVSTALGWGGKAPVCPLLITGNASVTAAFRGACTFYAGTNGCTVDSANTYKAVRTGAGYAGIQVDAGSSLTIEYAEDLTVYGAHQLDTPDANGQVNGEDYSDVLRANTDISEAEYDDPYDSLYQVPEGASINVTSGGAGIGGGAAYNTTSSGTAGYTQGTPGTIVINSGNIEAFGGHQAAGIGGGVNGGATADKIVINGGNITAHGGRWSAGIGDGDSTPNDGRTNTSAVFGRGSLIEINGGTVTSYGGVGSPGIGCSDGLEGVNIVSGMEIAVNGGSVSAFSGFPDGFKGTYGSHAPAAIGAGAGSNMASNSIYVSSAASLSCAGFGNYAMTENGVNASTVPVISVDSDGYLLLLRTGDYYSSDERILTLYKPQRTVHPDTGQELIIYVDQKTGELYYLDPQHALVYDGGFTELAAGDVPEHLTLHVDEDSEQIDAIELYYYFRSIALTLPDPTAYGGLYALTVPVDGITAGTLPEDAEYLIITIEAYTQGTQSGKIEYPTANNLAKDTTASRLLDLDAYETRPYDPGVNGLIGDDFLPAVYSYTVYVEPDAEFAMLYAAFENEGKTYQISLDGAALTPALSGATYSVSAEVDLTGVFQRTVRLKKMDNNSTIGAIVYKITFVKKGAYSLELSDPSKVYDGTPASVTANGVYSGTLYSIVDVPGSNASVGDSTLDPESLSANSIVYLASSGLFTRTDYLVDLSMDVEIKATDAPNVLQYIVTVKASQNAGSGAVTITDPDGYRMGWTVTYDEAVQTISSVRIMSDPDGFGNTTWVAAAGHQIASVKVTSWGQTTTYYLNLSPEADGTLTVNINSGNSYTLFQIESTSLSTGSGKTDTREDALQAAEEAVANGYTTGQFDYIVGGTYVWTQELTIGTVSPQRNNRGQYSGNTGDTSRIEEVENSYSRSGSGYYEIVEGGDYESINVPLNDLKQVQYTYYAQAADGNGALKTDENGDPVFETAGTSVPPADAGVYLVTAVLERESYNAYGSRIFTIERRPVTVVQVENWLIYLTSAEAGELQASGNTTLAIPEPGTITLDNVVSGDDVSLTVDASGGKVYYNSINVSYSSDKISLIAPTLTGTDAHNYRLLYTYEENREIRVFGQIAYDMQGYIFRKTAAGTWRKYYPVDAPDPVDPSTADYHSPSTAVGDTQLYISHAEYVKARTINSGGGEGRYCVDLEYGTMQFTYYYSTWDVNKLAYVENGFSHWSGMDGSNNKLTVINYSNRPVYYQMDAAISFLYADTTGSGSGITARIAADAAGTSAVDGGAWSLVTAAIPGDSTKYGVPGRSERYLILSGVPQMQASTTYTPVGTITVTVSARSDGW